MYMYIIYVITDWYKSATLYFYEFLKQGIHCSCPNVKDEHSGNDEWYNLG